MVFREAISTWRVSNSQERWRNVTCDEGHVTKCLTFRSISIRRGRTHKKEYGGSFGMTECDTGLIYTSNLPRVRSKLENNFHRSSENFHLVDVNGIYWNFLGAKSGGGPEQISQQIIIRALEHALLRRKIADMSLHFELLCDWSREDHVTRLTECCWSIRLPQIRVTVVLFWAGEFVYPCGWLGEIRMIYMSSVKSFPLISSPVKIRAWFLNHFFEKSTPYSWGWWFRGSEFW